MTTAIYTRVSTAEAARAAYIAAQAAHMDDEQTWEAVAQAVLQGEDVHAVRLQLRTAATYAKIAARMFDQVFPDERKPQL